MMPRAPITPDPLFAAVEAAGDALHEALTACEGPAYKRTGVPAVHRHLTEALRHVRQAARELFAGEDAHVVVIGHISPAKLSAILHAPEPEVTPDAIA